jgi:cell cycle checkpoint protein
MPEEILQSSLFRDAVSEVDTTCEKLTFFACPSSSTLPSLAGIPPVHGKPKPVFRIRGVGTFATTDVSTYHLVRLIGPTYTFLCPMVQVDFPNTHDVLETFECEELVKFR